MNHPNGILQICERHDIETIPPDFAVAYARLAPLVSEAWAYMHCGNTEKAKQSLDAAKQEMNATSTIYKLHFPAKQ